MQSLSLKVSGTGIPDFSVLPQFKKDDPLVRWYDFRPGDIIRIISNDSGVLALPYSLFYRKVTNSIIDRNTNRGKKKDIGIITVGDTDEGDEVHEEDEEIEVPIEGVEDELDPFTGLPIGVPTNEFVEPMIVAPEEEDYPVE